MCDGFGINMRLFSMYLNVGGLFESVREPVNPETHPVDVHFLIREPMRRMLALVDVDIVGLAESGAFIDTFTDVKTGAVNETATPGGPFRLIGAKVKILGDPDKTGVFFVPADNPDGGVKVTENLIENDPSKIFGIIPDLPGETTWALEVRTQYTHGDTLLKDPRVIRSGFTLTT
jgi:hypothetical protein